MRFVVVVKCRKIVTVRFPLGLRMRTLVTAMTVFTEKSVEIERDLESCVYEGLSLSCTHVKTQVDRKEGEELFARLTLCLNAC